MLPAVGRQQLMRLFESSLKDVVVGKYLLAESLKTGKLEQVREEEFWVVDTLSRFISDINGHSASRLSL